MQDKDAFIGEMVLDLVRLSNMLIRLGGKYANEAGLSSVQQYMVLGVLSVNGDLSMRELRDNTLVTKQAITGIVERLGKNKYIDTYTDKSDQRIRRVRLTEKGRQTLTDIRPTRNTGNREAFAILTDTELEQFNSLLEKLLPHLKELDI